MIKPGDKVYLKKRNILNGGRQRLVAAIVVEVRPKHPFANQDNKWDAIAVVRTINSGKLVSKYAWEVLEEHERKHLQISKSRYGGAWQIRLQGEGGSYGIEQFPSFASVLKFINSPKAVRWWNSAFGPPSRESLNAIDATP